MRQTVDSYDFAMYNKIVTYLLIYGILLNLCKIIVWKVEGFIILEDITCCTDEALSINPEVFTGTS